MQNHLSLKHVLVLLFYHGNYLNTALKHHNRIINDIPPAHKLESEKMKLKSQISEIILKSISS
jgi:hypothetical protein